MPGTPTQLTAVNATFTNTVTTASISPTASALLLIVVTSNSGGNHKVSSVSHTFGMRADGQGRTFKRLYNTRSDPDTNADAEGFGADFVTPQIFWGLTSATPGSGTVTVNINAGIVGFKVRVIQVTDVDLYMPIRQWHFTGTASSLASFTSNLPFTPLSSNMLLSISHAREATTTVAPDTGWTELSEDTTSLAPSNIQYRTGTTSTQFGVAFGATMTDGITIGAIEIRGPTTNEMPDPTQLRRYEHTSTSTTTLTVPTSGTVTVNAGDLILVPVVITVATGSVVASISSTFSISGSWQRADFVVGSGSSHARVEWWWAIASASGSGTVTITFTGGGFGTRGAWILSMPAGTFNDSTPFAQTENVEVPSLTAPNHLTDSFVSAPAAASTLVAVGMGVPNSNQIFVQPRVGWFYVGPPISEGGSQTSYVIYGREWQTFGGRFGLTPTTHDSTGGAVWSALEIQAPAAGTTGTLDETLAGTTLAASGEQRFSGSVSETLANATLAASGQLQFSGAVAETLDGVASTASGTVTDNLTGTLSETLDDLIIAATGALGFSGSLSETLDSVSPTASGELRFSGSLAETLAGVVSAASGSQLTATAGEASDIPGGQIAFTMTGYSAPPTLIELVYGGTTVNITAECSSILATGFTWTIAGLPEYALGQSYAGIPFNQNLSVRIHNPAGGFVDETIQINPPDFDGPTYWWGQTGVTPYPGDSVWPAGTVQNDDYFVEILEGVVDENGVSDQGVIGFSTLPATFEVRIWDVSAASWTSVEQWEYVLPIEGTVAEALGGVTAAASGTLSFSGTIAEILDPVTPAVTGTVGLNGTLAETLDGLEAVAAGELAYAGALDETLAGAESSAAGDVGLTGSTAETLDGAASAATGSLSFAGSLVETLEDTTLNASGGVGDIVGSVSRTMNDVQSTAVGEVLFAAEVNVVLGPDTLSALGNQTFDGQLSVTVDGVQSTAAGEVAFSGTLARTLADVLAVASGEAAEFVGSLVVQLEQLTLQASGVLEVQGTLAELLEGAILSGSGVVVQNIDGSLSVVLQGVTLVSSGVNAAGSTSQNVRITINLTTVYNSEQTISTTTPYNSSGVAQG